MERDEVSPSLGQAQRLKQLSGEGKLENNIIDLIMREEKPLERKVTLRKTACKNTFRPAIRPSRWRRSSSSCWRAGIAADSRSRHGEEVGYAKE